jgi:hypothetical protein
MQPNSTQLADTDQIVVETPVLNLPIDDSIILQTLDFAERQGKSVRQKMGVDKRSEETHKFWLGDQVDQSKLDTRYQMMHVDNVVRQNLENKIKLATGHMPDIFCAPPDNQGFNKEAAQDLQAYLRDRFSGGVTKRLLKNGLRKVDLDFIGIIKARYDKNTQRSSYELVDSKYILFGEGAKIYEDGFTIDGTDVLFHYVEEATQQVLNKFPKKAAELMAMLATSGKQIPSRIIYTEASFKWFDQQGNAHEGVAWRYGTVVLDKMRHPYFDYDNPQNNFFDRPRKNYIIISYANLGDNVYEATTDTEQSIPVQRIINRRRRQITEIADRSVPKLAFVGGAFNAELASSISNSPNEAIILSDNYTGDDIAKAMTIIPATPPNPVLYNDLSSLYGRMDSLFATHGTTRGEIQGGGESGVSKQITREGDLVTSDDIGEVTLERVIFEMASWEMQFLRMFRDDENQQPLRITNSEGETEFIELNRKKIEADIQAVVKASGQDKQTRRADALQLLTAQAIDPYTLFEDLDVPNPRERIRRLAAFIKAQTAGNLDAYMEAIGVDPKTPFANAEDAARDIDILRSGHTVQLQLPDESYVAVFTSLVNAPQFNDPAQMAQAGWNQWNKQLVSQHIQRMRQLVSEAAAKQQAEAGVNSQGLQPNQPGANGLPTTANAFVPGAPPANNAQNPAQSFPGPLGQAASQVLARRFAQQV